MYLYFVPALKFAGIKPPYVKDGLHITPLGRDVDTSAARRYLRFVEPPRFPLGQGFNGVTYQYNRFQVIKKHLGDQARIVKDDTQEVQKLDLLYALLQHHGQGALGNSQTGLVAIKPEGGPQHIVSTYVRGKGPDPLTNPLTRPALAKLIQYLTVLDQGTPELGRFMHFDLSGTNIKTTRDSAGIFDWEYLGTQRLDNVLKAGRIGKKAESSPCNVGDTFYGDSNLRNMEFRLLYPYMLSQANKGDTGVEGVKRLFEGYLPLKAEYHKAMQQHYQGAAKQLPAQLNIARPRYLKALADLANAEGAHARLLGGNPKGTPDDIKRAEMVKIQLAYYTFVSGPYCADGQYYASQLDAMHRRAKRFFKAQLANALEQKDTDRQVYYRNGLVMLDVVGPALAKAAKGGDRPPNTPQQPDLADLLYPTPVSFTAKRTPA